MEHLLLFLIVAICRRVMSGFRFLDCLLFRRTLDRLVPQLDLLRREPRRCLKDAPLVIGPLRRLVTWLPLSALVWLGYLMGMSLITFLVIPGLFHLLTGHSIWSDPNPLYLKALVFTHLGGAIVCIPLAFLTAYRLLHKGSLTVRTDGVVLRRGKWAIACPWPLFLQASACTDRRQPRAQSQFGIEPTLASEVGLFRGNIQLPSAFAFETPVFSIDPTGRASLEDIFAVQACEIVNLLQELAPQMVDAPDLR